MGKYNLDISNVLERLTMLETSDGYQAKKIDEIHRALVGNGQPGLLAEWNQMKGAYKLFIIIISSIVSLLGIAIAWIKIG